MSTRMAVLYILGFFLCVECISRAQLYLANNSQDSTQSSIILDFSSLDSLISKAKLSEIANQYENSKTSDYKTQLSIKDNSEPRAIRKVQANADLFVNDVFESIKATEHARQTKTQGELDVLNQQISSIETRLKEIEVSMEAAEKEQLISEYQKQSLTMGPKHPQLLGMLKEIKIAFGQEEFSHEQIIDYKVKSLSELNRLLEEMQSKQQAKLELEKTKNSLVNSEKLNYAALKETILIAKPESQKIIANQNPKFNPALLAFFMVLFAGFFHYLVKKPVRKKITQAQLTQEFSLPQNKIYHLPTSQAQLTGQELHEKRSIPLLSENLTSNGHAENSKLPALYGESKDLVKTKSEKKKYQQQKLDELTEALAADLILSAREKRFKLFLFVTSGKINQSPVSDLAKAFAKLSHDVLLVDANFSQANISQEFCFGENDFGFSDLLVSKKNQEFKTKLVEEYNLNVLPIGNNLKDAKQAFTADKIVPTVIRLSRAYKFVLIDGGDLNDSAAANFLASELGAVFLTIDSERTTVELLQKALVKLENNRVLIDGVLFREANCA